MDHEERGSLPSARALAYLQNHIISRDELESFLLGHLQSGDLQAAAVWSAVTVDEDQVAIIKAENRNVAMASANGLPKAVARLIGSLKVFEGDIPPEMRSECITRVMSTSRVIIPPHVFTAPEEWDTAEGLRFGEITVAVATGGQDLQSDNLTPDDLRNLEIPGCNYVVFSNIELDRILLDRLARLFLPRISVDPCMSDHDRFSVPRGRAVELTWHQWWAALAVAAARGDIRKGMKKSEVRRHLTPILSELGLKEVRPERDDEKLSILVEYFGRTADTKRGR